VLVLSLTIVAAIVVCALFVPTLLFKLAGRGSDDSKREAGAQIEKHVDTFATAVVGSSTDPAGPSATDLNELASHASLRYATERSGGALVALWVDGRDRAGGLFGTFDVHECYTISLHGLGTAGAGSQVTHLPDCKAVLDRLAAQQPTLHPSAGPSPSPSR
jgi:hypothetical protein